MRRLLISGLTLGLLSLTPSTMAGDAPPRIETGQPFPTIVLPDIETGEPRSIADFRGEKVILEIFASW